MQPWTLPRVPARTVAGTAAVAMPVLLGLAAAALVAAAPGAAVPTRGVAVVTDRGLGPVIELDRDGTGLADVTVDLRAVTP